MLSFQEEYGGSVEYLLLHTPKDSGLKQPSFILSHSCVDGLCSVGGSSAPCGVDGAAVIVMFDWPGVVGMADTHAWPGVMAFGAVDWFFSMWSLMWLGLLIS